MEYLANRSDINQEVVLEVSHVAAMVGGDQLPGILHFRGDMAGQELVEAQGLVFILEVEVHAVAKGLLHKHAYRIEEVRFSGLICLPQCGCNPSARRASE